MKVAQTCKDIGWFILVLYCNQIGVSLYLSLIAKFFHDHVIGPLCGEFTGHRWIPPHKSQERGDLFFFICARTNGWLNTRNTGDLKCHRAHCDIIVVIEVGTNDEHMGSDMLVDFS